MAFCIECGAKAPDVAKFCPQCGSALVQAEAANVPELAADPEPVVDPVTEELDNLEHKTVEPAENLEDETSAVAIESVQDAAISTDQDTATSIESVTDTVPSAAASLAAAATEVEDAPKSKAGLFIGLAVAVLAAGGGAYATGLFGGSDVDSETIALETPVITPTAKVETPVSESEVSNTDPILAAYQDAIKSGRISDLGKFAKENANSSLAKDAETAAFASLERQGSVLAYTTFIEYFPEADTSTYSGLRVNTDDITGTGNSGSVEVDNSFSPSPSLRSSITQRADELEPFIQQGDTGYAVAVIDEMLGLADLNETEATYLLNLRARAETSQALITPSPAAESVDIEFFQPAAAPVDIEPVNVQPAPVQIETGQADLEVSEATVENDPVDPIIVQPVINEVEPASVTKVSPAPEPEPDAPALSDESSAATPAFDTPAKPLERFGAITPDTATEPGECDMFFDVTITGATTNIDASCTDPLFMTPAKEAVSDWTYEPALRNGEAVQQNDVQVKIRFNLE